MSARDDYRKAVADTYRAQGARTSDLSALAANMRDPRVDISIGSALPRDPMAFSQAEFAPGAPPFPSPINLRPGGYNRAQPRVAQYPVGYNFPTGPGFYKLVPFQLLRFLADSYDVLRRCIEVRKQEAATVSWEIVPREDWHTGKETEEKSNERIAKLAAEAGTDLIRSPRAKPATTNALKKAGLHDRYRTERLAIQDFFTTPDRGSGQNFADWMKVLLEEVFVVDALAIYERPTIGKSGGVLGGDLFALEILDGSTIKPLVDDHGRRPMPPNPAYQQFVYGIPRTDLTSTLLDAFADPEIQNLQRGFGYDEAAYVELRGDQLAYRPYVQRTWTMYGFPNVEQIITNINVALRRQAWHLAYFTEGDIPAMLIHVPDNWTPEQTLKYEAQWHAMLGGDVGWKQRVKMVPGTRGVEQMKPPVHNMDFDDFIMHVTCMGMDVDPTEIGFSPKGGLGGSGYMQSTADRTNRLTLRPLLHWMKEYLDDVISRRFHQPHLELKFNALEEEDEELQNKIDTERIKTGTLSINEFLSRRGEEKLDISQADEPLFILAREVIQLSQVGTAQMLDKDQLAVNAAPGGTNGPSGPGNQGAAIGTPPVRPPAPKSAVDEIDNERLDYKKAVELEVDQFERFIKKRRARKFDSNLIAPVAVDNVYKLLESGHMPHKEIFQRLRDEVLNDAVIA